ncbi:MAG: hypothetical protein QOC88_30 [Mycobacterium sp.]|nr:hypothetical protein [Mycobacterium sp.]
MHKARLHGVLGERDNHMKSTVALARLGILAVGIGIGGAVAVTPGIAAADSSFDWLSTVDGLLSGGALSAADTTPALNLAISFDGTSLFQDGTAHAFSGTGGDIAIANGAGATAYAFGTNNYASVDGVGSTAVAGGTSAGLAGSSADNTAFVFGNHSYGWAGTTDPSHAGNFNYAVIFGDGDKAYAGSDAAGAGNYDGAYVEGNNLGTANAQGSDYLADILKFYGDGPTTTTTAAASESANHLTDLLGSDPSGALADGSAFWTDLFSGDTAGALSAGQDFWADLASSFDPAGAAADSSNAWTELLSAFDPASAAADSSNFWTELAALF